MQMITNSLLVAVCKPCGHENNEQVSQLQALWAQTQQTRVITAASSLQQKAFAWQLLKHGVAKRQRSLKRQVRSNQAAKTKQPSGWIDRTTSSLFYRRQRYLAVSFGQFEILAHWAE
jgi:hypothetical protein